MFEHEVPRSSLLELDAQPSAPAHGLPLSATPGLPDVDLAGFIARTTARSLIRAVALERPALLDDPLFFREVVTLLQRSLSRPTRKR